MAKHKNDYFKLMEMQAECSVRAAKLLSKIFSSFSMKKISVQRDEMHGIEHAGDELHHEILSRLSVEFITPIDQEDILHLVQIIDDVTDAIDEVIGEIYMFHIDSLSSKAAELSKMVEHCVSALYDAVKELKNFKKPEKLRELLVEVNNVEAEADKVFAEAIYELFGKETDARKLIGYKAVYESLEDCCDQCEHAADIIEQIVLKNS